MLIVSFVKGLFPIASEAHCGYTSLHKCVIYVDKKLVSITLLCAVVLVGGGGVWLVGWLVWLIAIPCNPCLVAPHEKIPNNLFRVSTTEIDKLDC